MATKNEDPTSAFSGVEDGPVSERIENGGQDVRDFDQLLVDFYQHERQLQDVPLERMLKKVQPELVPPPVEKKKETFSWRELFSRWSVGGSFALAGVARVLLLMPQWSSQIKSLFSPQAIHPTLGQASPNQLRTRGGEDAELSIYVKRAPQPRELRSGHPVFSGDRLRLLARWQEGGFLFIVHRDARGVWNPLYPESPRSKSLPIPAEKVLALPGSLEVTDPSSGDEELFGCFSRRPLSYDVVLKGLAAPRSQGACKKIVRFVLRRKVEQ